MDVYTLRILCIINEYLLYSSRNSVLCGDLSGKEIPPKEGICVHVESISLCCMVESKQHCKATIRQ